MEGSEMDKEFLTDYEAREIREIKRFTQDLREGRIKHGDRYPQRYRFRLNEPYTKAIDGEEIWSQIPLYGTTIISLKPTSKEIFEKVHGFDIGDVDRLIDIVKQTGRIQFALDEHPTRYINLDFLESLFRELMPPELIHIPLDCILDDEEIQKSYSETNDLLDNPQSLNFIKRYTKKKYGKSTVFFKNEVKRGLIHDLIRLRLLGYEDLVEDFIGWIATVDVMDYIFLLQMLHDAFLFSYDPLKGVKSVKRPDINRLHKRFSIRSSTHRETEFPHEVGMFLNDKLNLILPKDQEGAIKLSDTYDLHDLRKVMKALNEAVEKQKVDTIKEKSKEISLIFENVWREADKLKRKVNIYSNGISLGIGIVGAAATLPIAGVGGLLAGLGFKVADKILARSYESVSEKIMKIVAQSHILHIYDFKKKYKLI
jgi:hypothetical protein